MLFTQDSSYLPPISELELLAFSPSFLSKTHSTLTPLTFYIRDLLKLSLWFTKKKTFSQIFIAQMTKNILLNLALMTLWKSNPKLHFQLTNLPLHNLCTSCYLYCQTCFFFFTATPSLRSSSLSFLTDEIILRVKFLPPLLNIFCF